ncbi:hypothetical protein ALC62_12411 [Cyphomyrmex costatus]|uniref:Uncharacterized protein n=1 Tax=Cyphomyrmex costatus TaxID=456900 RepID=A0A151IB70_9HYME|nr:hypothetical protein ALC62_12411 [Cyphomyrmex costatus]
MQIEQSFCHSFGHFVKCFIRFINLFAIGRKSDNNKNRTKSCIKVLKVLKAIKVIYISYHREKESVPNNCSAVSTTSMIKSDGWIRLMTPSSLSMLDALSFPEELKPEARLKAAVKSASHHVTILIAANEACRGKSSLPPLMRMQRGSLKTVCISCIGKRDTGDASSAIMFVYPLAIYKIITFGSRFWRGKPNLLVRCLAIYNVSTIWFTKFHS